MSAIEIWHNPRCSKSRAALQRIEALGHAPLVRHYLTDPPDTAQLRAMLAALNLPAATLLRPEGKALRDQPDDAIIAAMAADPALVERPVVRVGPCAVIARPAECLDQLLTPQAGPGLGADRPA